MKTLFQEIEPLTMIGTLSLLLLFISILACSTCGRIEVITISTCSILNNDSTLCLFVEGYTEMCQAKNIVAIRLSPSIQSYIFIICVGIVYIWNNLFLRIYTELC